MTSTLAENPLTFQADILLAEAREAVWRGSKARVKNLFFAWLLLVIGVDFFDRKLRFSDDPIGFLIGFAIGSAIALVALWVALLLAKAKRAAKFSETNGPTAYTVTDQGITIEGKDGVAQLKWSAFKSYMDTPNLFLIRFRLRPTFATIPKRCLTSGVQADFIAIVSKHLEQANA